MDFLRTDDADPFDQDFASDAGAGAIDAPFFGGERRSHVAAHEHWAACLNGRFCPAPGDLDRPCIEDAHSVLIEMLDGAPILKRAGKMLLDSAGAEDLPRLSDLPPTSFLALLVAHYRQVLVSREPVAFTGEHVTPSGQASLYRAILLPLSSDGRSVDHILGTINWREFADSDLAARIAHEVDRSVAAMLRERPLFSCSGVDGYQLVERLQPELPLQA